MKAAVIKVTGNPRARNPLTEVTGWIVPGTDGLFAIDERYPAIPGTEDGEAVWMITHVPTGYSVTKASYTDAASKIQATAIARRFFKEATARGWNLASSDPEAIVRAHNAMPSAEKLKFWAAIAGRG